MKRFFPIRMVAMCTMLLSSCFTTSQLSSSIASTTSTTSTTSVSEISSIASTSSSSASSITSSTSILSSEDTSSVVSSSITMVTVTFNTNGGSLIDPEIIPMDSLLTEPVQPIKEGFIFAGWFTEEALLNPFVFTTPITTTMTLYASWNVDIHFGSVPIATFKTGELDTYDEIVGVVIFANLDMGLVVMADETDLIAVLSTEPLVRGDLIRMGGYRQNMDGYILMGKPNEEEPFITRYQQAQPIPITPTATTITELMAMDASLPSHWIQYIELKGQLTMIDQQMYIEDETNQYPLMMASQADYEWAEMHLDFNIVIDGILVPNLDDIPPTLMFIYVGGEDHLRFDYPDDVLLDVMLGYLKNYLESQSYYPGQVIDLPSSHPFLPMTVTYTIAAPYLDDLDLVTKTINPDITEPKTIEITAIGHYLSYEASILITLSVAPIVMITIAEFLTMPDEMTTFYTLEGVVIFLQLENQFVMLADATGVIYVITNRVDVVQGDLLRVHGVKMSSEGLTFLANDPSLTVMEVIASNQAMPLTPTVISIEAFVGLDALDPLYQLKYYALTGTLHYHLESNMYYLASGIYTLPLYIPNPASISTLAPFIDQEVTIQGLSLRPGSETFLILVFLDFPGDISVNPIG